MKAGLWLSLSAYNIVLHHLSPLLISSRQRVDVPHDRRSPVCALRGPEVGSKSNAYAEDGASLASLCSRLERGACGSGHMALTFCLAQIRRQCLPIPVTHFLDLLQQTGLKILLA